MAHIRVLAGCVDRVARFRTRKSITNSFEATLVATRKRIRLCFASHAMRRSTARRDDSVAGYFASDSAFPRQGY
jgi:hypothetical protein